MSQLFVSGGLSIGASALASVLSMNIQGWFPLGSPCSPRDSQVSSPTPQLKASNFWCSAFFMIQLSYLYMSTRKNIALTIWIFVGKVMSLLFNTLSMLALAFLPRSKQILVSWLQSPSAVILEPLKIKSVPVSTFYPPICHEVMGPDALILVFWMLTLSQLFPLFSFTPKSPKSIRLSFIGSRFASKSRWWKQST